jgi:hypothetical protein
MSDADGQVQSNRKNEARRLGSLGSVVREGGVTFFQRSSFFLSRVSNKAGRL